MTVFNKHTTIAKIQQQRFSNLTIHRINKQDDDAVTMIKLTVEVFPSSKHSIEGNRITIVRSKNNELAFDIDNNSNQARKIMQANKSDNDANTVAITIVNHTVHCDD